ncbi:hypothetical protein [uncultured Bacteroides sp.]|uniref:hypothetical protein n=1 Tax=uncultured Bacteroides sp. TaxID=162156 RepID=UPI002AA8D020|nr:hypothetical protein [uncultured Bacteroides sp.]
MRLTIKGIIRAEQLLKKPFNDINYNNEHDLLCMLYCISGEQCTLEVYKEAIRNKYLREQVKELERYSKVMQQFTEESPKKEGKSGYLSELAGMLIVSGIDANYVMNELELQDISFIVKAIEKKKKEELEEHRLWTYFQIAPHIDTKKGVNSPRTMYTFPWESEEIKTEMEAEFKKSEKIGTKFLNGEIQV